MPEIYDIYVDGKKKCPSLLREQARIYWKGLNIFGGHTAKITLGCKVLAKKGEFVPFKETIPPF